MANIKQQLQLKGLYSMAYSEFNTIGSSYNLEKSDVVKYNDLYNNRQARYLRRPSGMDLGKWKSLAKVLVPRSQNIINRLTDWLLEDHTFESKNFAPTVGKLEKKYFLEDLLTVGLVEGTCYVRADYNSKGDFDFSIYSLINSNMMYDSYGDPQIFMSQYDYDALVNDKKETVFVIEFITAEEFRKIKYTKRNGRVVVLEDAIKDNPYGVINVFPILYKRKPRSHFGRSYLEGVADLNIELSELYSGVSRILQYHASPALVIKGASKDKLTLGVDRILYLPENAEASYLTWEGKTTMEGYNQQISKVNDAISSKSGIPQDILTGNVPSGLSSLSLKILYAPVESLLNKQSGFWSDRIRELFDFVVMLDNIASVGTNLSNDIDISFNSNAIPQTYIDIVEKIEKAEQAGYIGKDTASDAVKKDFAGKE